MTTPENIETIVDNIKEYCEINGLQQSQMSAMAKGKKKSYKGYKCRYNG